MKYGKLLMERDFLITFILRIYGIVMMVFDVGSDYKLAYDLAMTKPAQPVLNPSLAASMVEPHPPPSPETLLTDPHTPSAPGSPLSKSTLTNQSFSPTLLFPIQFSSVPPANISVASNLSNITIIPDPFIDHLSATVSAFLGIAHPIWFSLMVLFIYLPHMNRVFSSRVRELIVKYFLHYFRAR